VHFPHIFLHEVTVSHFKNTMSGRRCAVHAKPKPARGASRERTALDTRPQSLPQPQPQQIFSMHEATARIQELESVVAVMLQLLAQQLQPLASKP
jgi:hypothetical protein